MGVPRPFPALISVILWFRKYAGTSEMNCHTFEEKAYYYLFFHITSW